MVDESIKDIVKEYVRIGNDFMEDIVSKLGSESKEIFENSLALVFIDGNEKYGFITRAGRFRYIDGEEVSNITPTATIYMTKDVFMELSEHFGSPVLMVEAIKGFTTYKITIESSDGRDYIHLRNLMKILDTINSVIIEALSQLPLPNGRGLRAQEVEDESGNSSHG